MLFLQPLEDLYQGHCVVVGSMTLPGIDLEDARERIQTRAALRIKTRSHRECVEESFVESRTTRFAQFAVYDRKIEVVSVMRNQHIFADKFKKSIDDVDEIR